jgi:hypothetical protein
MLVLFILFAGRAQGQQLNLQSLDKLGDRGGEKTIINLDEAALKLASGHLSDEKSAEAAAKKITSDLKGVYIRAYEFNRPGAFSRADLQPVRDQLKAPQWTRIVEIQEDNEEVGVWLFREGDKTTGIAILVMEQDELVVVNLVGMINPQELSRLSGQFGIPQIRILGKE